jgi:hypothetical protein
MARYLLRNGSYINANVDPFCLDVFAFRNFKGECIYAILSDQAEHALFSAWSIV